MVRIAPVRLSFNPKTLWFDSVGLDLSIGDAVVVSTARGHEFGHVAQALFDMQYEETKKLRSPLKSVVRLATPEDVAHADELAELSMQALPIFKQMANTYAPDMHPVAVEYLFGGEKAVFYFDSEERVDFRDLVRKLAAEFQVRVDMKQIGVRDGARMVGGIGHCGQELCCARLGGDFNPVSIRMAKEQDLSLNPQKISGLCGRLMCCLRYEFDAYKDFHGRAPKKNARIDTPDGEGKVVDMDVPREVISIKVGDEKPVKVPLADMDEPAEGKRPTSVGEEAWERANSPVTAVAVESLNLFTSQFSGEDKLAEPGKVSRMPKDSSSKSRRRRRSGSGRSGDGEAAKSQETTQRKQRRRRSTTVSSDGSTKVTESKKDDGQKKPSSSRRRRRRGGAGNRSEQQSQQQQQQQQQKSSQVGRNSSALRANRSDQGDGKGDAQAKGSGSGQRRRRRRSHKTGTTGEQ
ncbi:MAG: hypothetical protein IJ087_07315 [Eggerthellaceae bacterium]|nr:hypothetical protein [Eggerthellaceae bacterium]